MVVVVVVVVEVVDVDAAAGEIERVANTAVAAEIERVANTVVAARPVVHSRVVLPRKDKADSYWGEDGRRSPPWMRRTKEVSAPFSGVWREEPPDLPVPEKMSDLSQPSTVADRGRSQVMVGATVPT